MNFNNFAQGLLNPEIPAPDGVVGPNGRKAGKRYDVYRNNVIVSLKESLATSFPVVLALVGEKFFNAMSDVYVRDNPPKSPLMIYYGDDFADFLQDFPPVQNIAYIADVARLEWARRHAYHSEDTSPCPADVLAKLQSENLGSANFHFCKSLRIVDSLHPILSIWRFNSSEDKSPVEQKSEIVLICRPLNTLEMREISPTLRDFIFALQNTPLGLAVNSMSEKYKHFDVTQNLQAILEMQILTNITINEEKNA